MTKTTNKKLREEFEKEYTRALKASGIWDVYYEGFLELPAIRELGNDMLEFIESAIKEATEAERERAIEIIKNSQLVNPLTGEPDGFVHVDKVIEELSQQKDE